MEGGAMAYVFGLISDVERETYKAERSEALYVRAEELI
jgi:hypothetical protein